jgi:hypothetical protein
MMPDWLQFQRPLLVGVVQDTILRVTPAERALPDEVRGGRTQVTGTGVAIGIEAQPGCFAGSCLCEQC